jgi:hypothetical protein
MLQQKVWMHMKCFANLPSSPDGVSIESLVYVLIMV